jgi:hypothetical protein
VLQQFRKLRDIARLRRDVRLQSFEIEQLVAGRPRLHLGAAAADAAQADLVLYIEKRERLMGPAARE